MQVCKSCNISKSRDDYHINRKTNAPYPNCIVCYTADAAKFWSTCKFKCCGACDAYKSLRDYDLKDGVPYPKCRTCFETEIMAKLTTERRKRRAERAQADAGTTTTTQTTQVQAVSLNVQTAQGVSTGSDNKKWARRA